MEQIYLLLEYQNLDLTLDQLDDQRKSSTLRHKLFELKNYLTEQQNELVRLEKDVEKKTGIIESLLREFEIDQSEYNDCCLKLGDVQLSGVEIKDLRDLVLELKAGVEQKTNDLSKLLSESNSVGRKLDSLRSNVFKAKKEYTDVKQQYDLEVDSLHSEQNNVKLKRDELAKVIEPSLLARYLKKKDKGIRVLATIENSRCGGCNMMLSAVAIQTLKDKIDLLECENCGRLLFVTK